MVVCVIVLFHKLHFSHNHRLPSRVAVPALTTYAPCARARVTLRTPRWSEQKVT